MSLRADAQRPSESGSATDKPDVVVAWLQNDYGTVGRHGEQISNALIENGLARRVAYVEPFVGRFRPSVSVRRIRGVDVYRGVGAMPAGDRFARAVIAESNLRDPLFFNFGVNWSNWAFHHQFAPLCRTSLLLTHDKLWLTEVFDQRKRVELQRVRDGLVRAHDVVAGTAHGAIDDVPSATYVGHGCDAVWRRPEVDSAPEPADLRAIPRPRAIYVGALSTRIEVAALRELAASGMSVVLIGFRPSPEVQAAIEEESNIHFLGERSPDQVSAYLLHADVGIIPHTPEPFTLSMEPQKAYNYAAAGLRTVTLNAAPAPSLGDFLVTTSTVDEFVASARTEAGRRLDDAEKAAARALTWDAVAERLLELATAAGPGSREA